MSDEIPGAIFTEAVPMAIKPGILTFGREDKPFRQVQIDTLEWFEKNYEQNDVIIIEAPTAAGKSLMVTTIAYFLESRGLTSSVITPTKLLQDQYMKDFRDIPVLKGMGEYKCDAMGLDGSCRDAKKHMGNCCTAGKGEAPICNYLIARANASAADVALFNFHSYYANKMYKNVLIADEAHNAIHFLYDFYALKLWKCEVGYKDDLELNAEGVKNALRSALAELQMYLIDLQASGADKEASKVEDEIERYGYILASIDKFEGHLLIEIDKGEYYGKKRDLRKTEQEFLYVKPLRVNAIGEDFLWPRSVEKVILLSATISEEDSRTLGLHTRKVGYHKCPSPIPPDRRPFIICNVASMRYGNRQTSLPKIIKAIEKLSAHHAKEKGIVHCTYDTAKKIQAALGHNRRFMFHDKFNKNDVYNAFLASKEFPVLIASGMDEGIDLSGDLGRFQIITQLMRPSLEDKVNKWMVKNNKRQYNWETVRKVIQQTGRICRDPLDFGVTYILDSEFDSFLQESASMWPDWFRSGMKRFKLEI